MFRARSTVMGSAARFSRGLMTKARFSPVSSHVSFALEQKRTVVLSLAAQTQRFRTFTSKTTTAETSDSFELFKYINAASTGDLAAVTEFVNAGRDVDSADYDERRAISLACAQGHLDIAKFLIDNGADIAATDRFGSTILDDALTSKNAELVEYIRSKGGKLNNSGNSVNAFNYAASAGDIETMSLMRAAGCDVDAGDYDQRTAMHLAASEGQVEAVQWLLDQGANPNPVDRFSNTPFTDAGRQVGRNFTNCRAVLKEAGGLDAEVTTVFGNRAQFQTSLINSLPLVCQRSGFDYAEVWLPTKANDQFLPRESWASKDFSAQSGDFLANFPKGTVQFASAESSFAQLLDSPVPVVADIDSVEFPQRAEAVQHMKKHVVLPVHQGGEVHAIIRLLSVSNNVSTETQDLEELTTFTNNMVRAGVFGDAKPPVFPVKPAEVPEGQMEEVFATILQKGIFNANVVYQEIEHYYSMGFQAYYFSRFSSDIIANHIHSFMAAKRLSAATGSPEDIWLHVENKFDVLGGDGPEQALYMISNDPKKVFAAERRIQHRCQFVPTDKPYSLEYFMSNKSPVIGDKSDNKLSIYVLATDSYANPNAVGTDESNVWEIASDVFLRDKGQSIRDRYQELINESTQRLSAVTKVFDTYRDGTIPVMFCFSKKSDTHMLHLTELCEDLGLVATRKFVETFANGSVVFSLYLQPGSDLDKVKQLTEQFQMLHLVPTTSLTQRHLHGLLSANEYTYLSSVRMFVYYFIEQRSEEFETLSTQFQKKGDAMSLSRLRKLNTELKREAVSLSRINEVFGDSPGIAQLMTNHFLKRITTSEGTSAEDDAAVLAELNNIPNELNKQVWKACYTFNKHVLKTNFLKNSKAALSFRLDPGYLSKKEWIDSPYGIIMVVGSDFQGFHVRFADIGRGGIRMIRSADNNVYRNNMQTQFAENYGLANTQNLKNKDIPEFGSKGTVLPMSTVTDSNVFNTFQRYISSLMDMMLPDANAVDHYGQEELLFLGPDEGTAPYMEWAAKYAKTKDYKYWRSFTTGKPQLMGGIPHDIYGMTTRSVHRYVLGCLKKMNLKEEEVFKCVTGGPDGDLGSNEVLISKDKTKSIVDGSGVIYDPAGLDRTELTRLATERHMIDAFDTSKLGPDSFRVLITDVDYTLPSGEVVANGTEFRNTFHLHELFNGDVFVPCGGRPEAVNLANVGKFLDKNGKPKFKIIVEGANLFFSQNARLKLEEAGAVLYKDASTNKGGVTCSSKEVLAALALPEKFFAANMVVHDPANPPQFYQEYVEDVITVVEADADLEFEIIWSEHERTGEHRHILTDKISTKINDLTVAISNSSLYDDNNLRDNVLGQAVPKKLIDAIGLDQVIVNVPDNYLRAIFSTYVASRFVYKNGIKDNAFALHEHIQELKQ